MAQDCPAADPPPPSSLQAAQGAVLGAYVGDAAGVTLEFVPVKSDDQVRWGGGCCAVLAGTRLVLPAQHGGCDLLPLSAASRSAANLLRAPCAAGPPRYGDAG
jgi:hypothetical protein